MDTLSVLLLFLVVILGAHVWFLGRERRRLQCELAERESRYDELTSISNDVFNSHARLEAQVLLQADVAQALQRCRDELSQAESGEDRERERRQQQELDLERCEQQRVELVTRNRLLHEQLQELETENQRLLNHIGRILDK